MKKSLTQLGKTGLYYIFDGNKIFGSHRGLRGDVTYLSGDVTYLRGNVTHLSGNVTGLSGDVTYLSGSVDDCEITEKNRTDGVNVLDIVLDNDNDPL